MSDHVLVLSTEEVKALKALCRAGIKMADQGSPYFQRVQPATKTALQKLLSEVPDEQIDRK
jgi:hypothetical protein